MRDKYVRRLYYQKKLLFTPYIRQKNIIQISQGNYDAAPRQPPIIAKVAPPFFLKNVIKIVAIILILLSLCVRDNNNKDNQ